IQNCVDQAVAVARTITGKTAPYSALPGVWTDQFDIRLQMAGLAPRGDRILLRGNPDSREFSVFFFYAGLLRAVNSINHPVDHLASRKLIANRVALTPEQAADEGFSLKQAM